MKSEIEEWRKAHPTLSVNDEGMETVARGTGFPSLRVTDYFAYLESSGNEAADFVKKLGRECVWAYGMWVKAQRDADDSKLLQDIFNNASRGNEYAFTRKFLTAYAKANNLRMKA